MSESVRLFDTIYHENVHPKDEWHDESLLAAIDKHKEAFTFDRQEFVRVRDLVDHFDKELDETYGVHAETLRDAVDMFVAGVLSEQKFREHVMSFLEIQYQPHQRQLFMPKNIVALDPFDPPHAFDGGDVVSREEGIRHEYEYILRRA